MRNNGQREVPPLIKMEYRIFTKRKQVVCCSCKNNVGTKLIVRSCLLHVYMVSVAEWLRRKIVVLVYAGSIPVRHP